MKKTVNIGCPEKVTGILENIKEAVCFFSPLGQITYANKAYNLLVNKMNRRKRESIFTLFLQDKYINKFSRKLTGCHQKSLLSKSCRKLRRGRDEREK